MEDLYRSNLIFWFHSNHDCFGICRLREHLDIDCFSCEYTCDRFENTRVVDILSSDMDRTHKIDLNGRKWLELFFKFLEMSFQGVTYTIDILSLHLFHINWQCYTRFTTRGIIQTNIMVCKKIPYSFIISRIF